MLSTEELAIRKHTIGSSDVAAICGLSPWEKPGHVLQQKLDPQSIENHPAFKLGHKLERPVAELALEAGNLGSSVALLGGWTIVKDGWKSATPDFYALYKASTRPKKLEPVLETDAQIVEVKVVGFRQLGHWEFGKIVPDFVKAQVQWQMMILGYSRAKIVALLGGAEVKTFSVTRDNVWLNELETECRRFWEKHLAEGRRDKIWARVRLENLRHTKYAPRKRAA